MSEILSGVGELVDPGVRQAVRRAAQCRPAPATTSSTREAASGTISRTSCPAVEREYVV